MAKLSKQPSGGLSPAKAILIGILSVVLLLAIVSQFGGKKQRAALQPARRPSAAVSSESTISPAPTDTAPASQRPEHHWPTFNVADIVASNPFVLPEVLRPRREATKALMPSAEPRETEATLGAVETGESREMRRRQAEFMASLRAKGVDMILRSPRGSLARIGDLSLRVGDVHEGLRVEAIGQNGVVFAPAVVAEGQLK